ncbi:MAG: lipopolysaccharide biosynthesis protein [Planctomycetota bacterium]|jgi:O-antigen/teichoic acid export membrane protein
MNSRIEISKRLVLINSGSSVLAHLVNITILLWLHQHLLRRISPEEYAIYPVVIAAIAFVPLLASVLTSGLRRYTVEAYARGDENRITQIVSTMFPLLLACGSVILLLGFLLAWRVDRVLTMAPGWTHDAGLMVALLVFTAVIRLVLAPFSVGLYVRQKFVWLNLIQLGTDAVRLGILVALLSGVSTRVLWVAVASAVAEVAGGIVRVLVSRRLIPALTLRRSAFSWGAARELTSFGLWVTVLHLAGMVRTAADPLILNKLATAIDVTCFSVGALIVTQLRRASKLVTDPLQPPLTAMHATNDKAGLRRAYLEGGRYALWAGLALVVPLIIFRREVITLYIGGQYETAATVMALLLVGLPIRYGNYMMGMLATATAQLRPVALRVMINQLVNVGLTLYLVGALRQGAVGSALATLIVTAAAQPIWMWRLGWRIAEVTPLQWLRETVRPGLLPGIIGAAAWIGLRIIVQPATWPTLGGCVLGGALCYAAVLLAFCRERTRGQDVSSGASDSTSV